MAVVTFGHEGEEEGLFGEGERPAVGEQGGDDMIPIVPFLGFDDCGYFGSRVVHICLILVLILRFHGRRRCRDRLDGSV